MVIVFFARISITTNSLLFFWTCSSSSGLLLIPWLLLVSIPSSFLLSFPLLFLIYYYYRLSPLSLIKMALHVSVFFLYFSFFKNLKEMSSTPCLSLSLLQYLMILSLTTSTCILGFGLGFFIFIIIIIWYQLSSLIGWFVLKGYFFFYCISCSRFLCSLACVHVLNSLKK